MKYVLILIFMTGTPQTVTLETYSTLSACKRAGDEWLKPEANPVNTVKVYRCDKKRK